MDNAPVNFLVMSIIAKYSILSRKYSFGFCYLELLKKHRIKKIRFHDLRHSCATLLLNLGFSMKEIQVWLGHSDFQITAKLTLMWIIKIK